MSRRLELPVTAELAGIKVDTLLKKHLGLSGTVVRRVKWLEDGILVDGVRVNTRFCPREGQVLSVRLSDPERRSGIVPAPGPLDLSLIHICNSWHGSSGPARREPDGSGYESNPRQRWYG